MIREINMIKENIKADEVVESIARMNANEREKFVKIMVNKWTEMSMQLSNAIDQEVYDVKNYV